MGFKHKNTPSCSDKFFAKLVVYILWCLSFHLYSIGKWTKNERQNKHPFANNSNSKNSNQRRHEREIMTTVEYLFLSLEQFQSLFSLFFFQSHRHRQSTEHTGALEWYSFSSAFIGSLQPRSPHMCKNNCNYYCEHENENIFAVNAKTGKC